MALKFEVASINYIDNNDFHDIEKHSHMYRLFRTAKNTGGVEVYFINSYKVNYNVAGLNSSSDSAAAGLLVTAGRSYVVLAHELGHACGLEDIYSSQKYQDETMKISDEAEIYPEWVNDDWSGGSGKGYFFPILRHTSLLQNLLMHGSVSQNYVIPLGRIRGISTSSYGRVPGFREIKVGLSDLNRDAVHY